MLIFCHWWYINKPLLEDFPGFQTFFYYPLNFFLFSGKNTEIYPSLILPISRKQPLFLMVTSCNFPCWQRSCLLLHVRGIAMYCFWSSQSIHGHTFYMLMSLSSLPSFLPHTPVVPAVCPFIKCFLATLVETQILRRRPFRSAEVDRLTCWCWAVWMLTCVDMSKPHV